MLSERTGAGLVDCMIRSDLKGDMQKLADEYNVSIWTMQRALEKNSSASHNDK